MEDIKAVVLDIDGTISPEISWLALTRELGGDTQAHLQLYEDYKIGKLDYGSARDGLVSLWQATGQAQRHNFHNIFAAIPLHKQAQNVISQLSARFHLCIITGSLDMYAEVVANKLKVQDWYANTVLEWDTDGQLVSMDYRLDQARKKREQLESFCLKYDYEVEQCVAVGDSDNDAELFAITKHGVLVGDDAHNIDHNAWLRIDTIQSLPAALQL